MVSITGDQGSLFGPAVLSRPVRRRQPPKHTTVTITADAIAAMMVGRIPGERIIAEAVRAARPDVRNVAVDLGTIRWTDPKTSRRVIFDTPAVLRDALLRFTDGIAPEPFILGRVARVSEPALVGRVTAKLRNLATGATVGATVGWQSSFGWGMILAECSSHRVAPPSRQ